MPTPLFDDLIHPLPCRIKQGVPYPLEPFSCAYLLTRLLRLTGQRCEPFAHRLAHSDHRKSEFRHLPFGVFH